jgi:hypothetical protein
MPLSKRTRFEVFKRDKFTCQYCGRKAPDVLLQADHVIARANGGADDLMNLVTAGDGCNQGKSAVPLSDDSAVEKQRRQAELVQDRLEQVQMMAEWQQGLIDIDEAEIKEIDNIIQRLLDIHLTAVGKNMVRKMLRKYAFGDLIETTRQVCQNPDSKEVLAAIEKKLKYKYMVATDPEKARYAYVGGTLRNRFPRGWNVIEYTTVVTAWKKSGRPADDLYSIAKKTESWDDFFCDVEGVLCQSA